MIRLSEAIARANCQHEVSLPFLLLLSSLATSNLTSISFLFQITPPMVREAFSLLRQSIIHVEKDDIDFDDDGDEDGGDDQDPPADGMEVDDDAARDAADIAAMEEAESSFNASGDRTSATEGSSSAPAAAAAPASVPAAAPQKKKLKITYDKYMSIMNLGES